VRKRQAVASAQDFPPALLDGNDCRQLSATPARPGQGLRVPVENPQAPRLLRDYGRTPGACCCIGL